jgi:hypothetical protein
MGFRQYALSNFNGNRVSIRTISERKSLIGKAVGFDLSTSIFSQFGIVTNAKGKELEIDGSWYHINTLQQVAILNDQSSALEKNDE